MPESSVAVWRWKMSTPDSSVSDNKNKEKEKQSSQFIKIIKKRKKVTLHCCTSETMQRDS